MKYKAVLLGEVCNISSSKRIFAKEYQTHGIPFYRGKEVIEKSKGNAVSTELFISEERFSEIKKKYEVPEKGDILLTSVGTLGVPWLVDETNFYFKDGNLTWLRSKDGLLSKYLYLWLNSCEAQLQIDTMCIGSTQKALTIETLKKFRISLPSLSYQQKVCDTLYPIMKKIELNNKINENLEQQARVLYASLIADNECQLVRMENLAVKIAMGPFGSNIKVSTFVPDGVPIISGNHLRSFLLEEPSYNYITEEHAEKLKNSVVYPEDIIFTHAGNIGQVAMIPQGCDYPYYVISQRQFYMRCDKEKVLPEIILFFFHSAEGRGKLLANANSTGVPSIAQPSTHLKNIEMPLPDKKAQDEWHKVVGPMIKQYVLLTHENKRLAALRDTLLPKLMNGEIEIDGI